MSSEAKYKMLGWSYHWEWARQGENNPYVRWVKRVLAELPNKAKDANAMTVLDVGCGDGYPASLLVERGFAVVGIDPLEKALEVARAHVDFAHAQFHVEYPASLRGFDYVLALESIEHMNADDIAKLVEAVNHCKQYAIISTPRKGLDAYSVNVGFDEADLLELFGGKVELLHIDDEHQLFKIHPVKEARFGKKTANRGVEQLPDAEPSSE